jgi:Ser/Thr protein kinase RdoA (MazF antagonist)
LPAPQLIEYSSDVEAFGAPVVLMSYLEGSVQVCPADFADWIRELAQPLARLHQNAASDFPWQYRSWLDEKKHQVPAWTKVPHLWAQAIELWQQGQPEEKSVFLHRDYHPMNVLWQHGLSERNRRLD